MSGAFDAAGAARGQPRRRRLVGRRQGLSGRTDRPTTTAAVADHWFEDARRPPRRAYLRYSFTKGTEKEVDFLVDVLGLEPGMTGCSTSAAGRAATPARWPGAGIEVLGVDISRAVRRARPRTSPPRRRQRPVERATPATARSTAEFDAVISLCQGAFGARRRPCARARRPRRARRRRRPREPRRRRRCSTAWPGRCGPAGGSPCRRSRPTSRCAASRTPTPSTPRPGSTTSAPSCATPEGDEATPTSGPPASRRGSCACWPTGPGSRSATSGRSTPGDYARRAPDLDQPEFLLVAAPPA